MDSTYLPQDTKREYIRHLIRSNYNNYSDDDIARIAHTTKQYVWKEKSRMVSEGLLVSRRRTLKITAERNDVTTTLVLSPSGVNSHEGRGAVRLSSPPSPSLSSARTNARSNTDGYAHHLNIPPLDSEGIKKLYTEFKNKRKPVDIIAEHGFLPIVVEVEYKRFLKLHDIDIQRLQDYIGNDLLKYPLHGVELLEKSYKQKGYLTTEEMIEVLKKKDQHLREFG